MASTDLDGALRGVVAVGASARGVEALTRFAAGLPPDLPYAIAIVLHMPANAPSVLAKIIDRNGPLPAVSASNGAALQAGVIHVGVLGYTCPDCNGSLMTVSEGNYRCRVGHAWTADALLDARDDEVDGALWVALRSLQEKARLSRKLAENAGSGTLFKRYSQVADEAERALTILGKRLSIAGSVAGEHGGG
jgi:hypothetical protein